MSLFQFLKRRKEKINIMKKDVLGEWIHRTDTDWIFFVFYQDDICEYLDDEDDIRSWHYSISGNQLKLWGADKDKAELFKLSLNGNNLMINGIEYVRAQERWGHVQKL